MQPRLFLASAVTALMIMMVPGLNLLYVPIIVILTILSANDGAQWMTGLILPMAWIIMTLVFFLALQLFTRTQVGKQVINDDVR